MDLITGCITKINQEEISIRMEYVAVDNTKHMALDSLDMMASELENFAIFDSLVDTKISFQADKDCLLLFLDLLSLRHNENSSSQIKFELLLQKFIESIKIQLRNLDRLTSEQILTLEKYIASHLHLSLKITELAKLIGLNQQYLKTRFKSTFGITVHEYIIQQRLERALFMMKNTNASLQDIALKIGYSSLSSFSQAFKQKFGQSPQSYKISNS